MRSPYDVLGVGRTATPAEIRTAYRGLARRLHPDRPDGDEAAFVEVAQAYELLADPARRAEHDRTAPRRGPDPARPARAHPAHQEPTAPDLTHVAATAEDLDERWSEVLSAYEARPAPRRSRRWWR